MKFGAVVELATKVWVEFETEDEAPAQVSMRTAVEEAASDQFTQARVVEIRKVDG